MHSAPYQLMPLKSSWENTTEIVNYFAQTESPWVCFYSNSKSNENLNLNSKWFCKTSTALSLGNLNVLEPVNILADFSAFSICALL